jgi:signal transduction histidine kinase
MRVGDLRPLGLFDGLTDGQLGELVEAGTEVLIEPGVDLFHEGEHADSWWVLVDGAIELRRRSGREQMVVGRMDAPGRWAGGFRAWDENGVYLATGRGVLPGRVLRVPAEVLRALSSSWFPFGGHLIEGLFRTARTIESTARQRDSLVTLGTLSAGLAHEINNPTAAAARAVDALEETCATLLSSLRRLAEGEISAAEFTALDALRQEVEPRPGGVVDPLAVADLEDSLTTWLGDNGVERDWVIAPALAAAGVDVSWCRRAAEILGPTALEPGLEWVASTYATSTLLGELKEATGRVSELVNAVRSYSQMDRGSVQRIDVTEGIESTLVMLGHKLRGGVTLVRDYGADVPQIEAYAGELNQVWTNLIDNAVDAMDGVGTLTIATRPDHDGAVIEIRDTGSGMPPEVVARAFEAFFTTKDVGKGSGLGLDIARRIVVERHGGTIDIDSQPGSTVLRVSLPARPPG